MFKRKVFPPRFLNNMHCQGKVCYVKEIVKDVSVIMDEPSGTRREEISQQSSTDIQERQKYPRQAFQDTMR